jgi:adenosylhomocysteine nucleosidase
MRSRIAIVAAMPREIAPLVDGWLADEGTPAGGVFVSWSDAAIVVCAGMGRSRARLAAEVALHRGPVHRLISAGWCGALREGLAAGSVYRPSRIIDATTSRIFDTGESDGLLVTSERIADRAAKEGLARDFAADLVDMEASAVAELAREKGISFAAVKAVSDEYDFELPGMEQFVTAHGGFREGAFAAHLLTRPSLWRKTLRMARASSLAARNLCEELRELIAIESERQTAQAAR